MREKAGHLNRWKMTATRQTPDKRENLRYAYACTPRTRISAIESSSLCSAAFSASRSRI